MERKLAAIVFTDIVGFTKLSAENEPAALSLLEKQREILKPIVESHSGNWLKEIGDGLLLSFNTNFEAVNCAITIQKTVREIEDLNLRIGIHQGEVVFQGSDVVGDDVNIASRLEPFASPGGIVVSGRVNASLERDPDFETKFLCKPELKGVKQKVEIFCITSHGLPETVLSQTSAKLKTDKKINWNVYSLTGLVLTIVGVIFYISVSFFGVGTAEEKEVPSVAILPLDNKGDEEDEFYAYGISSDLISDVTSAGLIRVASLKEVEELGDIPFKEKAKKLFVRYIAQGMIWKSDSIFQLSMELYDTKTEKVVWSERWQKNWNELSVIRNVLAENILNELKVDHSADASSYAADPAAYEFYLKAKHKYEKRENTDDVEIVRGLLKKAIELDDHLIPSKLLFGLTYSDMGDYHNAMQFYSPALKRAESNGDKASISMAVQNIGRIYWNNGDIDKALDNFNRSLELREELNDKSGIGFSLHNIGIIYWEKGNYDRALDYFNQSLEIREALCDRRDIAYSLNNIGTIYIEKGDNEKALDNLYLSLEIHEELGTKSGKEYSLNNIGIIYFNKGEYETAIEYLEKSLIIQKEIGGKRLQLETMTFLNLAYKHLGKDYDEKEIQSLINEDEYIEFYNNFHLYELLVDKSYLETAYNQVRERADAMDEELSKQFLSYPIPKAITEEWERVKG